MAISLNDLANELINWCCSDIPRESNYNWNDELHLMSDFANYLNEKANINSVEAEVFYNENKTWLYLKNNEVQDQNGIMAAFIYDGNKGNNLLPELIGAKLKYKVKESVQNKKAIQCIVSVYNNLENRRMLHDLEFIEVFNDYGVGCAIKRLQ